MVAERKDATPVVQEPQPTQTLQQEVKAFTDKIVEVMEGIDVEGLPPDEEATLQGQYEGMANIVEVLRRLEEEPAAEITPRRLEKFIAHAERVRILMGTRYLSADETMVLILGQYRKRLYRARAIQRLERSQHENQGQSAQ